MPSVLGGGPRGVGVFFWARYVHPEEEPYALNPEPSAITPGPKMTTPKPCPLIRKSHTKNTNSQPLSPNPVNPEPESPYTPTPNPSPLIYQPCQRRCG